MRKALGVGFAAILTVLTVHAVGQRPLQPEAMRVDKVKENLYVIRGPFNACAPNGCGPKGVDDGLLHEAGDVAVRVTSEGVILVDDKFAQNVPEVLDKVKSITSSTSPTCGPFTPAIWSSTACRSSTTPTAAAPWSS